ncbi:CBS domain containing protein [Desulforamulus reducens MI-1]|uniref:CBS domain containing protein n=1 Tax=Desulforamulus reducens (strain ATCC BAA-1160 / DSM 100696 / MI-1) TaxID=349161 RepID=A4J611_DESRM|nr:CBS domain-containing protein [Desulforamulus reducens]ABO50514.1 CBS domain containing protein [Desulforamulus reducens MI-1]
MKEKRIKDLMTPIDEKFIIRVQDSLATAVNVMEQSLSLNGIASLLVIGAGQKPVGLLTFQDVIRAVGPKTLPTDKYFGGWNVSGFMIKPLLWEGLFTQRFKEEMRSPIHPWVKSLKEVSVKVDDTLMSAAQRFNQSGSNVLVVCKEENPVGFLSVDSLISEMYYLVDAYIKRNQLTS